MDRLVLQQHELSEMFKTVLETFRPESVGQTHDSRMASGFAQSQPRSENVSSEPTSLNFGQQLSQENYDDSDDFLSNLNVRFADNRVRYLNVRTDSYQDSAKDHESQPFNQDPFLNVRAGNQQDSTVKPSTQSNHQVRYLDVRIENNQQSNVGSGIQPCDAYHTTSSNFVEPSRPLLHPSMAQTSAVINQINPPRFEGDQQGFQKVWRKRLVKCV